MSTVGLFHVNNDGHSGRCRAESECPFSSLGHFATEPEARAAYEKSMNESHPVASSGKIAKTAKSLAETGRATIGEMAFEVNPDPDEYDEGFEGKYLVARSPDILLAGNEITIEYDETPEGKYRVHAYAIIEDGTHSLDSVSSSGENTPWEEILAQAVHRAHRETISRFSGFARNKNADEVHAAISAASNEDRVIIPMLDNMELTQYSDGDQEILSGESESGWRIRIRSIDGWVTADMNSTFDGERLYREAMDISGQERGGFFGGCERRDRLVTKAYLAIMENDLIPRFEEEF